MDTSAKNVQKSRVTRYAIITRYVFLRFTRRFARISERTKIRTRIGVEFLEENSNGILTPRLPIQAAGSGMFVVEYSRSADGVVSAMDNRGGVEHHERYNIFSE